LGLYNKQNISQLEDKKSYLRASGK
jgi:hypothetical protein